MNPARAFWASLALVIGSSLLLPFVTGYGTKLFQVVVLGSWSLVAAAASDAYADVHKLLVWVLAGALNVILFAVPAGGILAATRSRWPNASVALLALWFLFYAASLFILFPATDGP